MVTVRRVTLRATVCAWVVALSTIPTSGGQSPQQLPVFRAGTVLVKVDIYPRLDGRILEGLTKDDFQVFENGKLQPIEGFEFIRIEPNTPDAELRDPRGVEESNRQVADPRNRVFVVYIDTFHTGFAGGYYTREPLLTFLRRAIGPTDLFGVMTPDLPINRLTFARRIETIEAEIDKVWPWSEAPRAGPAIVDPTEQKLELCAMARIGRGIVVAHREDVFMTSLEQLLARLQTLRDERKNIIFFSEGWIPMRAQTGVPATSRPQSIPPVGVDPATGRIVTRDPNAGDVDKSWCEREATRLMNIDFERRYRDLLTRATQSNVGFYPVDVAGLRADQSAVSRRRPRHAADAGECDRWHRLSPTPTI
jgi:VWFA-related protein